MTREEAIMRLEDLQPEFEYFPEDKEALTMAIEALNEPEERKAEWIVTGPFFDFFRCSCCGYKTPWTRNIFNFCPHCGAKMEEEK